MRELLNIFAKRERKPLASRGAGETWRARRLRENYRRYQELEKLRWQLAGPMTSALYKAQHIFMEREVLLRPGSQLDHVKCLIPAGAKTHSTDVGPILADGIAYKPDFSRLVNPAPHDEGLPFKFPPAYPKEAEALLDASNKAIIEGNSPDSLGELAEVTAKLEAQLREAYTAWLTYRPYARQPLPEMHWRTWTRTILYHGQ